MSSPAFENLRDNQQQADMDGVMVLVSRQAVEEVLAEYSDLQRQLEALQAKNARLREVIEAFKATMHVRHFPSGDHYDLETGGQRELQAMFELGALEDE